MLAENTHEPIIDRDTFNKVQALLSNRRTIYKSNDNSKNVKQQSHVLAGKVRCLDCGGNLNRSAKGRNGEIYMKCRLSTKTKKTACTNHTVKLHELVDIVEKKIREIVEQFLSEQGGIDFGKEFGNQTDFIRGELSSLIQESKNLTCKVDELNRMLATAYTDKIKGNISENEFCTIKSIFKTDSEESKSRLAVIEDKIEQLKNRLKILNDTGITSKKHIHFEKLTHEMVNDFIDYIEVGEKNDLGEQFINIHWLF